MFVKDQGHYIGKILGISHSQCYRVLHRQISCLSWFYIENTSFVLVIVKKETAQITRGENRKRVSILSKFSKSC